MSGSHKDTIEQFTKLVNNRHVNHLDQVLDDHVEKVANTTTAFTNIQEAREYYSMEHEANPSGQWKILHSQVDDHDKNVHHATVSYNNHTYNTTYTFNSNGKIKKIHSHLQQQQQ